MGKRINREEKANINLKGSLTLLLTLFLIVSRSNNFMSVQILQVFLCEIYSSHCSKIAADPLMKLSQK